MTKPLSSLTPNIDKRLAAWDGIRKHLAAQKQIVVRPTVTISREFGCEGYQVAERVQTLMAEATGEPWNVYDKALLEAVASEQGIDMHTLRNLGDTARSFEKFGLRPPEYLQHAEAFRAVAEKLVSFAAIGNAVIVGRGGAVLCSQLPNCFHFRIEASLACRVAGIAKRLELSAEDAKALVEANTKLRNTFLQEQLHVDHRDRGFFHAIFNNDLAPADLIAEAIVGFVKKAWKSRSTP
jgi:cytidylate kinase